MVSILITAWKEEKTIGRCLETLLKDYKGDYEVLLGIPDDKTKKAALKAAEKLGIKDKVWISDMIKDEKPKGKPAELSYLMDKAKGDIFFFGDGDTYFGKKVLEKITAPFKNKKIYAVTGRPKSINTKKTMMGYFGNLLADAAHHKRTIDLSKTTSGKSLNFIKKRKFFPVSGYIFASRKTDIRPPKDCLVEDAFISYEIINNGGTIAYEPKAEVFVKFPKTLKDYFKQKKRTVGGYVQLWEYGVIRPDTKTRSFWRELEYFWFPIKYAESVKELSWSLILYPIRLYLWLIIYWERKITKKNFQKTWVRVESTK